jgi:hypothetical protein
VGEEAMSWYKVVIPDDNYFPLQDEFMVLFTAAGLPKDAALYNTTGLDHDYYFSPRAAEIAMMLVRRYSGVEVPAPTRSSVALIAGHSVPESIPFAPEI